MTKKECKTIYGQWPRMVGGTGMKAILGIDVDGTCMPFVFPDMTDPFPGFQEFTEWAKQYFHLHFFSTRFNPEVHGWTEAQKEIQRFRNWCATYNIHFDHVTPYKPPSICLIDDRAFGYDITKLPRRMDWIAIRKHIEMIFHEYIGEIENE